MDDRIPLKPLLLSCSCGWLPHMCRFYDLGDGQISIEFLAPRRHFIERARRAWRYLFGSDLHVAEVILNEDEIYELNDWIRTVKI